MRRPRLLTFVFICLFTTLISIVTLGQSNAPPVANRPSKLHANPTGLPRALRFGDAKAIRSNPITRLTATSDASELKFAPVVTYSSGGYYAYSIIAGDVNGDGKPDIVVGLQTSQSDQRGVVGVFLGNGDGTFQPVAIYSTDAYDPGVVALADVNGDAKPDLLVAHDNPNLGAQISVLLGNGDGTFQTAVNYSVGPYYADSVEVADVNGDGKPDIVDGQNNADLPGFNGLVGVLLGNGDGTFQPVVTYSSGGNHINRAVVADVNRDGQFDVIVANACADSACANGTMGVMLGNGDGTFQPVVTYGSGGYWTNSVTVVDVNGDGRLDALVANFCADISCGYGSLGDGTVGVLLGNGDGTFKPVITYNSGGYDAGSVAVADLNGDGKPDLAVPNYWARSTQGGAGVLLGNGDGSFGTAAVYLSGTTSYYSAHAIAVPDLNGDGKADLVVSNVDGTIGVLINNGAWKATTTTKLLSSLNASKCNQSVTFTATVTSPASQDKGIPTGTVTFFDESTVLINSLLDSSGTASLTISALPMGTHSITATYSGDTEFAGSTSSVVNQFVQDFSVASACSPTATVSAGQPAGYTIAITPGGGFNEMIALSCSGAPAQSMCSVSSGSVVLDGSTPAFVTVVVTTRGTSTSLAYGNNSPWTSSGLGLWVTLSGLSGLVVLLGLSDRTRKAWLLGAVFLFFVCNGVTWLGCGGGTPPSSRGGTPAGTYNLTVTGTFTSASATLTHGTQLTLVVK